VKTEAPRRGCAACCRIADKAVAIEDVVAEHQGDIVAINEVTPDQKGLREPVGPRLLGIGNRQAPLAAVFEQRLEPPAIRWGRDDEDFVNAREHQVVSG
jgi:hypothetical protein